MVLLGQLTDTIFTELDYFTLLSTLQDVQAFYFMPVPGFSSEIFKRNTLKAYTTAQLVVRQALKLQSEIGFLFYAPHYVCRTLLASACIILNVLLSPYMKDMPVHAKDAIMQDSIFAVKTCSVHDTDLPARASKMIESYWSVHHTKGPIDIPMKDVSQFSSRLGTSFAFDYIRRWKRDIEASRSSVTNANGKRQATGTPSKLTTVTSMLNIRVCALLTCIHRCVHRPLCDSARKCAAHRLGRFYGRL